MLKLKTEAGRIKIPNNFNELSFEQAVKIKNIEIPESVVNMWTGSKSAINLEITDYYNKVLGILDETKCFDLDYYSVISILSYSHSNISNMCYSLHVSKPFQFDQIDKVKVKFTTYKMAESRKLIDDSEPLSDITAIELIECLTALNSGFEYYNIIAAILYKKKYEFYSELNIIKKAETFRELSCSTIWTAVHKLYEFLEYINTRFPAINKKINTKQNTEFAFKKSGLAEIGYNSWIDDIAKSYQSYTHKQIERMNVYKFLEIYNKLRADNNFSILASQTK